MSTVKGKIAFLFLMVCIIIMFVMLIGEVENFKNKKATFYNGSNGLSGNGPIVLVLSTPYAHPVSKPVSKPTRVIYIKTVVNRVLTQVQTVVPSRATRTHARSYKAGSATSYKRLHTGNAKSWYSKERSTCQPIYAVLLMVLHQYRCE